MKFSPSSAERWFVCAGSTVLHELAEPTPQSKDALQGSNAHAMGEYLLKNNLPISVARPFFDDETLAAIETYIDYVRSLLNNNSILKVEQFFTLVMARQRINGKVDSLLFQPETKEAHVIDYKNGGGILVYSEDNPQLMLYALGALAFSKVYKINLEKVHLTIVQPKNWATDAIQTWTIDKAKLKEIFKIVYDRLQYIIAHQEEYIPGEHCHWCPGILLCKKAIEYKEYVIEAIESNRLSIENIKQLLHMKPIITEYFKSIETKAQTMINQGIIKPNEVGKKWVMQRTNRQWVDEYRILQLLKEHEYTQAIKESIGSIRQLEKLFGKEWVNQNTIKKEGQIVLASIDDKREEIVPFSKQGVLDGL